MRAGIKACPGILAAPIKPSQLYLSSAIRRSQRNQSETTIKPRALIAAKSNFPFSRVTRGGEGCIEERDFWSQIIGCFAISPHTFPPIITTLVTIAPHTVLTAHAGHSDQKKLGIIWQYKGYDPDVGATITPTCFHFTNSLSFWRGLDGLRLSPSPPVAQDCRPLLRLRQRAHPPPLQLQALLATLRMSKGPLSIISTISGLKIR